MLDHFACQQYSALFQHGSVQAVYKQLNGKLKPYLTIVNGKKMLQAEALEALQSDAKIQPEANNMLITSLQTQIQLLNEQIKIIASKVEPVSQRLASPIMQKKIQKETARLLWEDKTTKEKLSKANEQLNSSIEKLQQEIDTYTETINDKVESFYMNCNLKIC